MNTQNEIPGFKGFEKGMKCRDFQYKENEIFEENVVPETCERGFHYCQNPLDVFNFYPPNGQNEYAEVVGMGQFAHESNKTATNKLKIKGKISIGDLFKAAFEIVKEKCLKSTDANTEGDYAHANTAGNYAHANTAGNYAHANTAGNEAHANTAGNYAHANTAGYKAHANTSGNESIACSLGINSKAKAEKGWIVIVDWQQDEKYDWFIKNIHSAKVGQKIKGVKIESTKYYFFKNGNLESCES